MVLDEEKKFKDVALNMAKGPMGQRRRNTILFSKGASQITVFEPLSRGILRLITLFLLLLRQDL